MREPAAEVIVVGLGAIGAATLLALARQGVRAIGIDRYQPPHDLGSSHGESRITRLAVGEGPDYAPLVRRSHEIWRQLERETGETLFRQTGGLVLGPREGAARHHGKQDFVRRTIAIAEEHDIPHEVLDADGIAARFPQFRLRGDELGCFEPSAGIIFPERCIAVQLGLAQRLGAAMRTGTRVLELARDGTGVLVRTNHGAMRAARVILAAGPWVTELGGPRVSAVARVYRQTLHWFAAAAPERYAPGRCPVFIWMHGDTEEDYFYGFPTHDGGEYVKVASERYAHPTTPDSVDRSVSEAESAAIHARHVAGRLDGVTSIRARASACLYTVTPDAGFVVDAMPGMPDVILASACSGHGFKHSAALGEVLARQATGAADAGTPAFALSRFP